MNDHEPVSVGDEPSLDARRKVGKAVAVWMDAARAADDDGSDQARFVAADAERVFDATLDAYAAAIRAPLEAERDRAQAQTATFRDLAERAEPLIASLREHVIAFESAARDLLNAIPTTTDMRLAALYVAGSDTAAIDKFMTGKFEHIDNRAAALRALLADHPTKDLERRGTLDG